MPVTTKDIARELGLSQPTVSRILNGNPQHRVAASTRERVLEAARRMEYQPNAVARSLRSGRTHIVGLYTSRGYDARNDFLAEILGGLQHACARHHLDLLLHIDFDGRSQDDLYNKLCDGRIDGLLLHISPDDPLLAKLGAAALPVIALADPMPQVPSVTCDDEDGMRQLMEYLGQRQHQRFVFIAPQFKLASVERRLETWQGILATQGVAPEAALVLRVPIEDAASALAELVQRDALPCAVCCWNDQTAYSLLRAGLAQGIRVPEDMAVTGFDGFLDEKLPARHLVTIDCPWVEVAVSAVDLLTRQINGEAIAEETRLPVTLLTGDTA